MSWYMMVSVMLSLLRNMSVMLVSVSWSVRLSVSWSVRLSVFVGVNFRVYFWMIDRHAHVTEFPMRVTVLRVMSTNRK